MQFSASKGRKRSRLSGSDVLSSQWEGRYVSGNERGRCDLIIISIPVQITNKQAEEPYTTTALAVLLLKTHTHTQRPGSNQDQEPAAHGGGVAEKKKN
jgi:hypothetical protein